MASNRIGNAFIHPFPSVLLLTLPRLPGDPPKVVPAGTRLSGTPRCAKSAGSNRAATVLHVSPRSARTGIAVVARVRSRRVAAQLLLQQKRNIQLDTAGDDTRCGHHLHWIHDCCRRCNGPRIPRIRMAGPRRYQRCGVDRRRSRRSGFGAARTWRVFVGRLSLRAPRRRTATSLITPSCSSTASHKGRALRNFPTQDVPQRRDRFTWETNMNLNLFRVSPTRRAVTEAAQPVVYVVDGDPTGHEALEVRLRSAGYQPCIVASAEEFLAQPRCKSACCLLVEKHLPGLSGLELQTHVRNRVEMPIIFLSSEAD